MSGIIAAVAAWRAEQRARSAFRCDEMPLAELRAWRRDAAGLAHDSGGFFRIVAVRTRSNDATLDGHAQPFILQPEIGILGFLARPGADGPELLAQAKTEPGNEGATQLAPSFQCTPSNYTARHGGTPAPYLDAVASTQGTVLSDLRQSEQGTRFLGKFNRNMVVMLPSGLAPPPAGPAWRWLRIADMFSLLGQDNVLNTDARSVLAGTPWRHWSGGAPFARWRGTAGFGAALLASHASGVEADVIPWLLAQRASVAIETARIKLADLTEWHADAAAIAPLGTGGFAVRGYRVTAEDREVAHWDQPLVDSAGIGMIALLCQRRDGVLRILLQARAEPGLANRVEIAASVQVAPGESPSGFAAELASLAGSGTLHLRCQQSEEGGRFHRDGNEYRVVELPPDLPIAAPDSYRWATVATLEALCTTPGMATNEARSAASLLLAFV